ncbi:PF09835 family protein [Leptospira inadai serovar Lyme str. 10]|uniref:PF09835 family protein n=2 Tax=Leptospira inadai serovar Lyme TaxID=293084 RepID=V6H9Y9_9LEPT|nr:DUF2062 domain-containing protein [Leptospira inadai]EQA35867.1 PF09835 family protein [Leptospira inadai serovar Lyme str. 10]PNV76795.1 DUF2062 domain-containing protein [Leptospira inadai serovar Lyme]
MTASELPKSRKATSFVQKTKDAIIKELKTGTTPEKIALSLALGAGIGVFPLIGTTMALCALLGFLLRLNPVSVQIANYLMYPFQVLFLIPFLELGARISGKELDLGWAYRFVDGDASQLWEGLSNSAIYAVVGWGSIVPLLAIISYFILLPIVKKINQLVRKDSAKS